MHTSQSPARRFFRSGDDRLPVRLGIDTRAGGRAGEAYSQSDLVWCLTGRAVATTPFIRAWRSRNEIEIASECIAGLLEAAGIPAFGSSSVTEVGLVTGAVREIVPYRPSQLIPVTASRDRASIVQALSYYATRVNRGDSCRSS